MGRRKGTIHGGGVVYPAEPPKPITPQAMPAPESEIPFDAPAGKPEPTPKPVQRCRSFHPAMSELRCILGDGHVGDCSGNGQNWPNQKEYATQPESTAPAGWTEVETYNGVPVGGGVAIMPPPATSATAPARKPKTPEQLAADERRIKQVMEYLTATGKLVRFGRCLFYGTLDPTDPTHPSEAILLRIWTEHDLVVWFNAAARHMGKQGCTMNTALAATMPESRKYDPVTVAKSADEKQEGTLWEAGT